MTWGYTDSETPANRVLAEFVAERVGIPRIWPQSAGLAVLKENELIAGCVYHDLQPEAGTVELTMATADKRWLTRPIIRAIMNYPLNVLGCQLVIARCDENNTHTPAICRRLGCDEYVIPRLRGPTTGELIFTMTAEDWARSKFGDSHGQFAINV